MNTLDNEAYLCSCHNPVIDEWCFCLQPKPIEVQVISHQMQRYAVWFGGSMLASTVSTIMHSTIVPCVMCLVHGSREMSDDR